MKINLVKCCICDKLLNKDEESVYHNNKIYCFEHFEEEIQEEQDKELND